MSDNSKNRLQEHFQQLGKALPVYDTGRAGGTDHEPLFTCRLTLFSGETFQLGSPAISKKKAELQVAEQALNTVRPKEEAETVTCIPREIRAIVFVDVENQSRGTLNLLKQLKGVTGEGTSNSSGSDMATGHIGSSKGATESDTSGARIGASLEIHFVVSRGCSLVTRVKKAADTLDCKFVKVFMHITDILRPGATNTLIMILASRITTGEVVILSDDRFAHTFVEMYNDEMRRTTPKEGWGSEMRVAHNYKELLTWMFA